MKKLVKTLGLAAVLLGLASCGELTTSKDSSTNTSKDDTSIISETTSGEETVAVVGVEFDKESDTCDADYTKQLNASVLPANATDQLITYSSSDNSIASVDASGLLSGHKNGTVTVTATTNDGGFTATISVEVTGYHKAPGVWNNIGKIENNTSYNADDGVHKDFTIDTSNEEYTTVKFIRNEVKEWASFRAWYDTSKEYTSLDVEVELVKGTMPNFLFELSGELSYKQWGRVPLTLNTKTTYSVNLTDYNMKTGEDGNGSWGILFLEFNNPSDPADTTRDTAEEVELRIHKFQLNVGDKVAPATPTNFRFDATKKALMLDKQLAAANYAIELGKDGATPTEIDVTPYRFAAVEQIPTMQLLFTPKKEQIFNTVPGEYKARIKAINSIGESNWTDLITFTVVDPEAASGYTYENISNDGAIFPNEWNSNKTYAAELKTDGYELRFTASGTTDAPSWDSFLAGFDKAGGWTKFHMEFETISETPVTSLLVQFNDWGEGDEGTDGLQQEWLSATSGKNVIDFNITTDLTKGLGQLGLGFDRGSVTGDVVIRVTSLKLSK